MNTDNIDKLTKSIAIAGKFAMTSYPVPKSLISERAFDLHLNTLASLNSQITSISQSWSLPITQEFQAITKIADSLKPISINFPTISIPIGELMPKLSANIQLLSKAISLSGLDILSTFELNKNIWSNRIDKFPSFSDYDDLTFYDLDEETLKINEYSFEEIKDIVDGNYDESKQYDCLDVPSFISRCGEITFDDDPDILITLVSLLTDLTKTTDKSAHLTFWDSFATAFASKLGEHSADIVYFVALLLIINYFNIKFDVIQKLFELFSLVK